MPFLEQQLLVLYDKQRSANASCVCIDLDLSLSDVSHHGHLRHDDVHLTSELLQGVHQLFWVSMDTYPAAVYKDFCGTGNNKSIS